MKKLVKKVLAKMGYKVIKNQSESRTEKFPVNIPYTFVNSYLISPNSVLESYIAEFSAVAYNFYLNLGIDVKEEAIAKFVHSFFETYRLKEIEDNSGGSGFHNSFWLYMTSKVFNPELIIESGVWKGHSSWLLQKSSPLAKLYAFDISFSYLIYKSPQINYVESDWSTYTFDESKELISNSICFFDDHIDSAKRVIEAYEKGFRRLIFDDSPPLNKMFTFGIPPFPTVPVIMDTSLNEKIQLEYVFKGVPIKLEYDPNGEIVKRARSLIRSYQFFPDVSLISQIDKNRFIIYVDLVD